MTNLLKVEGIIINKKDIGDFDRIVTMFTGSFGKIDVLIKGIRKSKKRDKIGADILSFSRMVVYKKENSYIGTTVESVKNYNNIREDMKKIGIVLYMFHVLNNILTENERKSILYDLTLKSLDYIEKEKNSMNYTILLVYYLHKIIIEEGLKYTVKNGRNFSIKSSVISEEFLQDSIKLNEEEYKIIEMIYFNKVRELLKENIRVQSLYSVLGIYEKYLNYHMEIYLDLKNYILEA
ncbi:DNA repair protein RecO [Fusobacterium perfoetens]|uniref:DNA repair protein RecO n=1 Tax=Fusobacterium perfoetens TaxID=852 RepID=UPI001F3B6953|nr:DNA repair protein RecO [Fusobacterium perfoetens]MCF2624719.1 DNA repair protein RecO [Fusobacterium perfoetens]